MNFQHVCHAGPDSLTDQEFQYFSKLIFDVAGIKVDEDKISMLQGRLNKRLNALNLSSYMEYQQYLTKSADRKKEMQHFVNALTTNKTEFFRESIHFKILSEAISKLPKKETLYLWSGAASTGQEIYSLAITLEELIDQGILSDYRILATDIDTQCLNIAQNGRYTRTELEGVPPMYLQKYFSFSTHNQQGDLEIRQSVKNKIKFRQYNLVKPDSEMKMQFDFIFLRNVLFYFTKPTTKEVVNRLANHLVPGGLFFISLTESLTALSVNLSHVSNSVYRKE